jgi:thiol-disulfide isomerase/thioredoxin
MIVINPLSVLKKLPCILLFLFSALVSAQDWKESYSEALDLAEIENKPIVLVFAGSDWCAPCIKLERSIWQSGEFIQFAKNNYVLYKADFPRKKDNQLAAEITKQNSALASTFNPNGHFPLVVVLNSNEEVLGKIGYKKLSPNHYISLLNSFVK